MTAVFVGCLSSFDAIRCTAHQAPVHLFTGTRMSLAIASHVWDTVNRVIASATRAAIGGLLECDARSRGGGLALTAPLRMSSPRIVPD